MVMTAELKPLGCMLAVRVLQSDLYQQLDDTERGECDELVRKWNRRAPDGVVVPFKVCDLDPESKQILYANLWELYDGAPPKVAAVEEKP